jgi:hypothetical protein
MSTQAYESEVAFKFASYTEHVLIKCDYINSRIMLLALILKLHVTCSHPLQKMSRNGSQQTLWP